MLLVTAVYAALSYCFSRTVAHFVMSLSSAGRLQCDFAVIIVARATRIESARSPAGVCDATDDVHAFACGRERDERRRRAKREGQRRTRNNQRADRTDEWDTTVEDIVRSIDGIGVCNVN